MRACRFFYYFITLSNTYCVRMRKGGRGGGWVGGGRQVSLYYFLDFQSIQLAMQDSHPSLYCTKTWFHLYISDEFL